MRWEEAERERKRDTGLASSRAAARAEEARKARDAARQKAEQAKLKHSTGELASHIGAERSRRPREAAKAAAGIAVAATATAAKLAAELPASETPPEGEEDAPVPEKTIKGVIITIRKIEPGGKSQNDDIDRYSLVVRANPDSLDNLVVQQHGSASVGNFFQSLGEALAS